VSALLEIRGLSKHFPVRGGLLRRRRGTLRAVDAVDLDVARGECVAVVGESGSGKTTLGRCALRLIEPTAGRVRFAGRDLLALGGGELRRWRRHFQMVFQDPDGSLDPRRRVGQTVAEPLQVHRLGNAAERRRRVEELLHTVGLPADAAGRYPHEFSGGQRQRIGIARALASEPELLVADEPVSALDVSVRAQIVNLLAELQQRLGLSLVFIAHDLALVEHLADRVAVMYRGRLVEVAPAADLFARPQHPYTVSLLNAIPRIEGPAANDPAVARRGPAAVGGGAIPAALAGGCPFAPRCPIARRRCGEEGPALEEVRSGHLAACFFAGELEQNGA